MRLPPDAGERLAAAIAEAEGRTAAELVLVGTPASGRYRDVDLWVAAGCALLFLLAAGPIDPELDPLGLMPPLGALLSGALGGAVSGNAPFVRRLLTRADRRERQAREAALVAFHERGVDRTRDRTGLLVHVSFLERVVTLVPDRGVLEEVTTEELAALRAPFERALALGRGAAVVDGLCAALAGLGAALADRLPRGPDDVNELADAPAMGEA